LQGLPERWDRFCESGGGGQRPWAACRRATGRSFELRGGGWRGSPCSGSAAAAARVLPAPAPQPPGRLAGPAACPGSFTWSVRWPWSGIGAGRGCVGGAWPEACNVTAAANCLRLLQSDSLKPLQCIWVGKALPQAHQQTAALTAPGPDGACLVLLLDWGLWV
jgi:hypothetical protein